MDFGRCQPPCSRLIASEDQHGKCVRCVGLAHARDVIFGISNCMYCKNFTLKTLRTRIAYFIQRIWHFSPPRFSGGLPPPWSHGLEFGGRAQGPWRMSSFHFLSLHRLGVTAQILRSSFLAVVLHPAQRHGCFLRVGGYFIYRGLRHRGLLRPTLSLWKFWRAPLRSWA